MLLPWDVIFIVFVVVDDDDDEEEEEEEDDDNDDDDGDGDAGDEDDDLPIMMMMVVILSREMKGWTFARQLSWPSTMSATTRRAARTSPSRCSSTCSGAQLVALLATQSGSRWRKPPQPSGSFCWGASWGPTSPGSSSSPASWPSGWAWRPSPFSATLCRPTGWRWTASSRSTCTSSRARRCATSACGSCRTCTSTRCSACCRSTCGSRRSSWSSPRTSSTTTASSCWGCWRCRQETASPTWWCTICGTSTTRDKEKVPQKVPLWPAQTNQDHRKNDEGWFWMLARSSHPPCPLSLTSPPLTITSERVCKVTRPSFCGFTSSPRR